MFPRIAFPTILLAILVTFWSVRATWANAPGDRSGDERRHTSCDPCHERVARYRALGLPESRLQEFVESDRTVTDWYNREHLGGPGMKKAGWALVGLGLASITLGVALMAIFIPNWWGNDDEGAMAMVMGIIAIPCLAAGGLETAIGIPMVIVGHLRIKRWAKDSELDRVPLQELEKRRPHSRHEAKLSLGILPFVTRSGGGLSLSLRF